MTLKPTRFKSCTEKHSPKPGFTFTGRNIDFCRTGPRTVYFQFHSPYKTAALYKRVPHSQSDMSKKTTVRIENRQDRWRFVCPRGHRTWEPTNHHFWCQTCARAEGVDGVFYHLRDRRTGREYERENVQLLTASGPYDSEIDGRESA